MIELIIPIANSKNQRHYYRFYLENEYHLWLDEYEYQVRKTSHSKWIVEKGYSRLDSRRYYSEKLEEINVILNDHVKEKVREIVLKQLQIQKWSER